MTPNEIKETGQKLFKAEQYSDALPLLKSAAEAFPKDESLWRDLLFAASWSGQHQQAVEFAKEGIRQHPRSDWLWRELGIIQVAVFGRLDEADKALKNARCLNPNEDWVWRYFVAVYRQRKHLEKEIETLERLHALGVAKGTDLIQLGIAHYFSKSFEKALDYYRLAISHSTGPRTLVLHGVGLQRPGGFSRRGRGGRIPPRFGTQT